MNIFVFLGMAIAMFVGSLSGFSFDSSGFEKSAVRFRIFISSDPSVAK